MLIMTINIDQHRRAALICWLCVAIVAGSNNLKILKNVDGTAIVEVPSKIEVLNGADLTFTCQLENIKNKGIINGYVTWFIPPKIHLELNLRALKNSSNLVFRNVNTNDEGLYVCASLKFKIFKTLYLLVKQSKSAKKLSYLNPPRLTKREIISWGDLDDIDTTNLYHYNPSILDVSDIVNRSNAMHEDLLKAMQDINKHQHDEDFNYHKKPNIYYFPFAIIVSICGICFAGFVIYILIRIHLNSCTNRDNHQQNIIYNPGISVPRSNTCGHATCSSGACRFHDNSLSTGEPLIYNSLNPTTQLDIPPTYSSSTHNSTQNLSEATYGFDKTKLDVVNSNKLNLLPSYHEAIADKDDNHIATVGHNHNGTHNSGHNCGVDNCHVHHSISDGISGFDGVDNSGGGGDSMD